MPDPSTIPSQTFRDTLATVSATGKRNWIYAQQPKGKWYNRRTVLSWAYFVLFFSVPFIYIHGVPLFQINIPQGKFILFTKVFWPQDFFIFALAMIAFIVFIILFTAAFGRLFCGWACPQTIFMEMLFRRLEYWIEGSAAQQKLLNKAPWTTEKIIRKTGKHIAFFLLSFLIANTFLAYIIGIHDLKKIITEPVTEHLGGFFSLIIFTGIFYSVYAFFREQACTVVCPYGRLQGVLLDKNSVAVAYDYNRGEPRGKFKKGNTSGGDCIDCFQCVKVCPTGIDIRNGIQMECVGCTACIDACDRMMESIGKPLGLIRYASENSIAKKQPLRFTGRMKLYSALLLVIVGLLSFMIYTRKDVIVTVLRAPGMLYQERGTDSLSNLYNVKLSNKTIHPLELTLEVDFPGARVEYVGKRSLHVAPQAQGEGTFFIVLPQQNIQGRKTALQINIYEGDKKLAHTATSFLGPVQP